MYQLIYKKEALKALRKMPANTATAFRDNFERIAKGETEALDIKPLSGSPYYRLRIGDYRGIYEVDGGAVKTIVLTVKPRGDVYKWLRK